MAGSDKCPASRKAADNRVSRGESCWLRSMDGGFCGAPARARLGRWSYTVAIEYRWSEGRTERYTEIAAEFAHQKVDVIVTVGSAVPTVRQAAGVIPIVFAVAIDPVRSGLVCSLANPGGNVTGLSLQATHLRRDARLWRSRSPDLLLRFPLLPLDPWPDEVRLPDIEPRFICQACGSLGRGCPAKLPPAPRCMRRRFVQFGGPCAD